MKKENIVLFVDDEGGILRALSRSLRHEEYISIYVECGETALEIIRNNPISVIVSDIGLMNMSGVELLQEVENSSPEITKIALTGQNDLNEVYQIFEQINLYRYITKPWDDKQLKEVINLGINEFESHKNS